MGDSYERKQKVVGVKMYPKEIEALDVIAKLAGWDHRSTALREFMKIWIECAVVTLEKKSVTQGTWQMIKSIQRVQHQIRELEKNGKQSEQDNLLHDHDIETLKEALAI
jgi:hypothetical protein